MINPIKFVFRNYCSLTIEILTAMKNILVAIDFEEETQILVNKALEFAKILGSKVWLLHIAAGSPDYVGYGTGPQYIRDSRADTLRKEHQQIQKFASELKEKNIEAEGLMVQGSVAESILKETSKLNIDLVIIGHHKHSSLYKIFVDDVDSEIISNSKVPVLIIPL